MAVAHAFSRHCAL